MEHCFHMEDCLTTWQLNSNNNNKNKLLNGHDNPVKQVPEKQSLTYSFIHALIMHPQPHTHTLLCDYYTSFN